MDITTLASFIGGGSTVAVVFVYFLKKWFDEKINEKYSAIVAQGILLLISILIAGIAYCVNFLPEYVLAVGGIIFGVGMGIYDVLKAMGIATGIIKK